MLGRKLKPVVFKAEENAEIQKQLGVQEVQRSAPKSTDPVNFPVWDILVGKKALIYVPNHVFVDEAGVEHLRMDKPLIHYVTDGKRFYSYRCISGLVAEEQGFTGECPLCEGCSEPWDLANIRIEARCKQVGLNPEDVDNQDVKNIRSSEFSDRAIKEASRYYTFPIVVFETQNDDAKTLLKDEDGNYKYRCYWYSVSETLYEDKWKKILDGMEDEPTHPGGHFFILNYIYTPKHGEQNKRDAARNLQVVAKNIKGSEKLRAFLDEATREWTPEKARDTVIANNIYSTEGLQYITDEVLEPVRLLITTLKNPGSAQSLEANGGFTLEQKPEVPTSPAEAEGGIPLDDTDDDFSMDE